MDFAPRLEAEDTGYGFRYCAIRRPNERPDALKYVKVTVYMFPTTEFIARPMDPTCRTLVQIFVPIDDEQTMRLQPLSRINGKPVDEAENRATICACGPAIDIAKTGAPRWHTPEQHWIQDRPAMKNGSWCGIYGFPNPGRRVPRVDGADTSTARRSISAPPDIAIIRMRRLMLDKHPRRSTTVNAGRARCPGRLRASCRAGAAAVIRSTNPGRTSAPPQPTVRSSQTRNCRCLGINISNDSPSGRRAWGGNDAVT